MKKNKNYHLFWLLFLIGITTSSCSFRRYGSGGSFELTIWESAQNHDMIEEISQDFIEYYEGKYPELEGSISIEVYDQEEGSSVSNLQTYASSGQGPDVFAFANDTLCTAVDNDLIDPLGKETYACNALMSAASIEATSLTDDTDTLYQYAYPYAVETSILIYNTDELSAEDVVSFEALKNSGKKLLFDIDGSVADTNAGYYLRMLLTDSRIFKTSGSDPEVSNDTDDFEIDTEQNIANLKYFFENCKDFVIPALSDQAYQYLTSTQEQQHVSAVITTPYNYNILMKHEDIASKIAVAAIPTLNGITLTPFNGYKAYGVSRYAKNPALAHEFAYYLSTNLDVLIRRAQIGVNPVIDEEVITSSNYVALALAVSKNECTNIVNQTLDNGDLMPSVSNFGKYWTAMSQACKSLYALADYSEANIRSIITTAQDSIRGK